jgi:hypothetical protein
MTFELTFLLIAVSFASAVLGHLWGYASGIRDASPKHRDNTDEYGA